jgi:uncharacterized protein
MKLPDVNIWLALALSGHSHHEAARTWLDAQETLANIFFCRATQQGLVRLLTTAEVLAGYEIPPLTNREAWAVVESFMADERISFANAPADVDGLGKPSLSATPTRQSCGWTHGSPPSPSVPAFK